VSFLLAYGVSIPPAARHLDLTPLLAIIGGIAIWRFVVGAPLTPLTGAIAAFSGALWAYLAEGWGLIPPSVAALLLVVLLRSIMPMAQGGNSRA
jgi:hypothetical protein